LPLLHGLDGSKPSLYIKPFFSQISATFFREQRLPGFPFYAEHYTAKFKEGGNIFCEGLSKRFFGRIQAVSALPFDFAARFAIIVGMVQ
jgi:hypothetical protein